MSQPSAETSSSAQLGIQLGSILGGKYRVDGLLGMGGMGVVLSATNLALDAPVAIKVVREELANNEEVVSRMVLEARSAAKLRGAHVVRVLDVARLESGAPYIVMERLAGSDLATLLSERGALPMHEAIAYVLQACEGLAEAHALGIVHRDLKPENLFLASTPEGPQLKILDFGISKDTTAALRPSPRTALTNAGCTVGSPFYMSPEQMRASPEVDRRSDIWSLGAVLFELLTGKSPFDGESVPVVCAKVLNQDPPPLSVFVDDAPEQLDTIIRRCLAKDPNARYREVAELALALRDFASQDLVSQQTPGIGAPLAVRTQLRLSPNPNGITNALRPLGSSPTLTSATQTDESLISSATSSRYEQRPAHQRAATVVAVALAMTLAGGLVAIGRRGAALAASPPSRGNLISATVPAGVPAASVVARAGHATVVPQESSPIEPAPAAYHAERAEGAPEQPARATVMPGRLRGGSSVTGRHAAPVKSNRSPAADPGALYDLYWSNSSGRQPTSNDADFSQLGGRY